jgi:regulatory subunit for Cdc7p protein kinase
MRGVSIGFNVVLLSELDNRSRPAELDNILSRLLPTATTLQVSHHKSVHPVALNAHSHAESKATLSYLLETERNTGVTHERDPTAQRQDYRYFARGTYWLLIEDMDGTHAPLAVKDYGRWKPGRNVKAKLQSTANAKKRRRLEGMFDYAAKDDAEDDDDALPPWPSLRDQPGKAKPDWAYGKVSDSDAEVGADSDVEGDAERESLGDEVEIQIQQISEEDGNGNEGPGGSVTDCEDDGAQPTNMQALRRTASMHDIGRAMSAHPASRQTFQSQSKRPQRPLRGADREYNAASGNSVAITSHVNSTTSYAYGAGCDLGPGARQLEKRLHQQVLTRAAAAGSVCVSGGGSAVATTRKSSVSTMQSQRVLRRAKSTNALRARGLGPRGSGAKARLPSREEVKKPGYCENCRVRFEDFNKVCVPWSTVADLVQIEPSAAQHIVGKRHRRFAEDDNNFAILDELFTRLSPQEVNNGANQFDEQEDEGHGDSEADEDDDGLEIIGEPSDVQFFNEQLRRSLRQSVQANLYHAEHEQGLDLTMQLQSAFPDANTELQDVNMDDPFIAH